MIGHVADVELHIELDTDAEPISGVLRTGTDGRRVPFAGWIELVQAIERIRCGDGARRGPRIAGAETDTPQGPAVAGGPLRDQHRCQ
jgi:hypothetical protein